MDSTEKKVIPSATYKVTLDPVYMEGGYLSQKPGVMIKR